MVQLGLRHHLERWQSLNLKRMAEVVLHILKTTSVQYKTHNMDNIGKYLK